MGIFKRSRRRAPATGSVADALFTPVQQRVLGVLFGNPSMRFALHDIADVSDLSAKMVKQELARLEKGQLIVVRRVNGEQFFQAYEDSPLFNEVRALVVKTFGVVDVLRVALASQASHVHGAFAYGAVVKNIDANIDIDLLVISDAPLDDALSAALDRASEELGRKIKLVAFSAREFARRMREKNVALAKILVQPRIWIVGATRILPR